MLTLLALAGWVLAHGPAATPAGAQDAARETLRSANLPGVGETPVTGAPVTGAPVRMAPIPDPPHPPARAPRPDRGAGEIRVHVFGDSLGDGVWAGLYRLLPRAEGYRVIKHSRVSTGLVRDDYFDWPAKIRAVVARERVDVAVVVMGTNDRQPIVAGGRHPLRSPEWERLYRARIDAVIETLKDAGAEIYWMGLPAMRSPRFGRDMQYFNSLYRERAAAHGIHFVPTWTQTLGGNGSYSAYAPDARGRMRLMRTNDGVHFTMRGYMKLAGLVRAAMDETRASAAEDAPAADRQNTAQAPAPDRAPPASGRTSGQTPAQTPAERSTQPPAQPSVGPLGETAAEAPGKDVRRTGSNAARRHPADNVASGSDPAGPDHAEAAEGAVAPARSLRPGIVANVAALVADLRALVREAPAWLPALPRAGAAETSAEVLPEAPPAEALRPAQP